MPRMTFLELVNAVRREAEAMHAEIPAGWMQGRTLFGGVSAALSLHAARELTGEARALRSAMVNFVGPSAGAVRIEAEQLRRGRNVSAVRTRLSGGAGPAAECVFTFADHRESTLDLVSGLECPAEAPAPDFKPGPVPDVAPAFMKNFHLVRARGGWPFSGGAPEQCIWVRHADPASRAHPLSLIALADVLAPAISGSLTEPVPLSSMTWMIDMLVDAPETERGWWLLGSKADHARGGYSTQDMTVWNARGEPVAKGRQMVAVFA